MLTITVNGQVRKLSIGCRTFISLDVLLEMLEADLQFVTLNGEIISRPEFGNTTVKGGDSLLLK
jgi:sulfur carrier protein ThiS